MAAYLAAQPGVAAVLQTSALTGLGVDAVRDWAVAQLPEGPTLYPKARSLAAQPHAAIFQPFVLMKSRRRSCRRAPCSSLRYTAWGRTLMSTPYLTLALCVLPVCNRRLVRACSCQHMPARTHALASRACSVTMQQAPSPPRQTWTRGSIGALLSAQGTPRT